MSTTKPDRLASFKAYDIRGRIPDELNADLARDDRKLDNTQKHGTTMLLAIRHWQFAAFANQERPEPLDPLGRTTINH